MTDIKRDFVIDALEEQFPPASGVAFAAAYAASPKTDVHRSATGSPPV